MLSTHQDSVLGDLIEVIDIRIERKLICSLQESPYFSIIADECQDISTQEELSICGRWLVYEKLEKHFLWCFMHVFQMPVLWQKHYILLTAKST